MKYEFEIIDQPRSSDLSVISGLAEDDAHIGLYVIQADTGSDLFCTLESYVKDFVTDINSGERNFADLSDIPLIWRRDYRIETRAFMPELVFSPFEVLGIDYFVTHGKREK